MGGRLEMLTWDAAGADASGFGVMRSRSCISSLRNPLLSRNAIFLSVDAFLTSSFSRNCLACSINVSRPGDLVGFSVSFVPEPFDLSCHDDIPDFFRS